MLKTRERKSIAGRVAKEIEAVNLKRKESYGNNIAINHQIHRKIVN